MVGAKLIELVATIGKKAYYTTNGMKFPVKIEDVKTAYGKFYYYIRNEAGQGKWTTEDCIEVITGEKAKAVMNGIKEFAKEFILP